MPCCDQSDGRRTVTGHGTKARLTSQVRYAAPRRPSRRWLHDAEPCPRWPEGCLFSAPSSDTARRRGSTRAFPPALTKSLGRSQCPCAQVGRPMHGAVLRGRRSKVAAFAGRPASSCVFRYARAAAPARLPAQGAQAPHRHRRLPRRQAANRRRLMRRQRTSAMAQKRWPSCLADRISSRDIPVGRQAARASRNRRTASSLSEPVAAAGVKCATTRPWRVMAIVAPPSTRRRSSAKWDFASVA